MSLTLKPKAIVEGVSLNPPNGGSSPSLQEGASIRLNLGILTPAGQAYSFPWDDVEVSYQPLNGGVIEGEQKFAVFLKAPQGSGGGEVGVQVSVQALASDHTIKTFTHTLSVPVLATSLPSNDGLTVTGTVANLPSGFLANPAALTAFGGSTGNTPLGNWGTLNPDGSFQLQLPPGQAINREAFSFLPLDDPTCTWTDWPERVNGTVVQIKVDGVGRALVIANNLNFYQPGNTQGFLLYMDRPLTATGTCAWGEVSFNLTSGWNLLLASWGGSGRLLYTGGPFNGSLPTGLQWFIYPDPTGGGSNASVGVVVDLAPPEGAFTNPPPPPPPSEEVTVPSGSPLLLEGWAEDETALASVQLLVNLAQELPLNVNGSSTQLSWNTTWTPPAPGRYYLDLIIKDQGGNSYTQTLVIRAQ
ncbi:hypothetical protein [Thermus thalpophilus]